MDARIKNMIRTTVNALIIAGIIIFFIGAYHLIVKAGIPYQDAPLELRIRYAVDMKIGNVLTSTGFMIAACSSILRAILGIIWKKARK